MSSSNIRCSLPTSFESSFPISFRIMFEPFNPAILGNRFKPFAQISQSLTFDKYLPLQFPPQKNHLGKHSTSTNEHLIA